MIAPIQEGRAADDRPLREAALELFRAGGALGGAALLAGRDVAARTLFAPYELPVGVVLSLAGGPFFLWLLFRKGRGHP